MSGMNSVFPPGSIKSIQRGTITLTPAGGGQAATGTYTLSPAAVDLNKCRLRLLGFSSTGTTLGAGEARVALTNTTTVTAYGTAFGGSPSIVVGFEFEECY